MRSSCQPERRHVRNSDVSDLSPVDDKINHPVQRGDSWRARVSHICDLQVSLFSGQIKIDFGGLDRWDFAERQRNMTEAEQA